MSINALLSRVRIVLVETSHPGNVGAAARAMKTMGLARLALVNPGDYPSAQATARASGADDLLHAASVHESLAQALQGCTLVIGSSARRRSLEWPEYSPREAAGELRRQARSADVALVFGREQSGLSNEELAQCNAVVRVPTEPGFSSLNVAAAVQILAYELFQSDPDSSTADATVADPLATHDEVEDFYAALQSTLVDLEFLDPSNPRHLMKRLRRLFGRSQLSTVEVNILRGVLTAVDRKAR